MSIGSMRQRIQLQSKTVASDGGGSSAVTAWSTFAIVYGNIVTKSGNKRLFGDQLEQPLKHVITIRFRRNLTHANRLQYKFVNLGEEITRVFSIDSIINIDNKDKYLEISCTEGVAT
tara:strand:- start:157 stop:507 length:351 start_codon:yes stop_codon:yes gene_type:complete